MTPQGACNVVYSTFWECLLPICCCLTNLQLEARSSLVRCHLCMGETVVAYHQSTRENKGCTEAIVKEGTDLHHVQMVLI